jgi:hypothetical protein
MEEIGGDKASRYRKIGANDARRLSYDGVSTGGFLNLAPSCDLGGVLEAV